MKKIFYWLLLGISTTIGVQGIIESEFENDILESIAETIEQRSVGLDETKKIDTAVQVCYYLQERRSEIVANHEFHSLKSNIFESSLQSFYVGTGACGFYSIFTARVFQKLGYRPKIVQQRVNGQWGAHITMLIPLKQAEKSILIDPLFHHVFTDSNGRPSSIKDVSNQWSYFSKYVPKHYALKYDYQQGWRYTNWDKLGFVSRGAFKIGGILFGKKAMENVCIRMWIIDTYRMQSIFAFSVALFCLIFIYLDFKRSGLLK